MITLETAKRLSEALEEIKECTECLTYFYDGEKPTTFLHVELKEDNNICFPLTPEIAVEALKKYLEHIEAECKAINDKAIKEASNG